MQLITYETAQWWAPKSIVQKDQIGDLKDIINASTWQSKKEPETVYQPTDFIWLGNQN